MSTDTVKGWPYFHEQYYLYELDATLILDASVQFKLDSRSWLRMAELDEKADTPTHCNKHPRDDTSTHSFFIDARGPEDYEAFVDIKIHSSIAKPLIISLGKKFHDAENVGHLSITDRNGLPVSSTDTPVRNTSLFTEQLICLVYRLCVTRCDTSTRSTTE